MTIKFIKKIKAFFSLKIKLMGLLLICLGILFSFLYQNCNDITLKPMEREVIQAPSRGPFCLEPPEKKTLYSKILFIVDQSGSNQDGQYVGDNQGTDPSHVIRRASILKFLEKFQDNEYYKWSLMAFKEANAVVYTKDNQGNPIFTDAENMKNATTNNLTKEKDGGCTPYLAALVRAKQAIEKDIVDHPDEESVFNIFFLSDGGPRIQVGDNACGMDKVENSLGDKYLMAVKSIREKNPSKIFVSTVYYNTTNPNETERNGLSYMATAGDGSFTDMTSATTIDFEAITVGKKPESWLIKGPKIITYNLNSAFCDDKTIDMDSDTDGLCDKDEVKYNTTYANALANLYPGKSFNPTNRNSLDPNYNDSYVWKFTLLPTGSGFSTCNKKILNVDADIFNSCEKAMLKDKNANGPTPQWTEFMAAQGGGSADPLNPDSDGDLFLDSLEFFTFRALSSFSAAVNHTNLRDYWASGVDGDEVLYHHRHFMIPSRYEKDNYDTKVTFAGVNDQGFNCYDFVQNQLALYSTKELDSSGTADLPFLTHKAAENVVLIYFIATQENDPNGTGTLYYSYQTLDYNKIGAQGASELKLDQFKSYKIPKH